MYDWLPQLATVTLLGLVGTLLRMKDSSQEKQIAELKLLAEKDIKELKENHSIQITALWKKHDDDALELRNLESHLNRNHYEKQELDRKFSSLEKTMNDGFATITSEIKALTHLILTRTQEK